MSEYGLELTSIKHEHKWQFTRFSNNEVFDTEAQFICECGATKWVDTAGKEVKK
jgi:hypothetical protein